MQKMECKITLFGDTKSQWFMDENTYSFSNPGPRKSLLILGDSRLKIPWTPFYRVPWSNISEKTSNACNMICTLNPDIRVDFDVRDRKICNKKLLDLLWQQKKNNLLEHIILVYEYGEKGKGTTPETGGKLHFHLLCKVQNRETWEKEILQMFNRRSQVSHRTLQTKLVRTPSDRSRYLNYMKKENQNKIKTLLAF